MNKLPERARVRWMALDALIVATVWSVILLFMDYPREDWIGVMIVGYVSLWITRAIVAYILGRVMERLLHLVNALAKSQGIDLPEPPASVKSLPSKAQLQIIVLALSVMCAFIALSVIFTGVIIGFVSLEPLASGTMTIAIIVAAVGTAIAAWRIGATYFMLIKSQRLLNPEKMYQQGQYVDGLGRLAVALSP